MEVDGDDSDEYEEIEEEIEVTDDEQQFTDDDEEEEEEEDEDIIIINKQPLPDVSQELELEVHKEHLISDSFDPVVDNTSKFSILDEGKEEEMEVEEEEEEEETEDVEKEPPASSDVSQEMELEVQQENLTENSFGLINETIFSIAKEEKDEATVNIDDSLKPGAHLASFDDLVSIDVKKDPVNFVVKGSLKNFDANSCKAFVDHGAVEEPSIVDGKEIALAVSTKVKSTEEANGVVDMEADIRKVGEQSRADINEGQTSSSLPQIRLRSLSPVTELNVVNKKPAIICNFFAKGWCIKGGSCKFLHVKEHVSINSQKPNEDDIGVGDSTTISPISAKRSQSRERGENYHFDKSYEILPQQQEGFSGQYKDSSVSNFSFRDFGGESLNLNSVEDKSCSKRLSTPTTGPLQSFSSSTWTRAHMSIGSLDRDPLHGYGSTSLLRSSSPFSNYESKSHCLKDLSVDRNKVCYDDWEPSLPFRPSFPYTKNLLAPFNLYDPVRDSIEKSKSTDLPKLSLRTISHSNRSTDKDPAISKNIESEYGSDKQSISGQNRDLYKGFLLSTKGETMETYNDERNSGSNLPKEEKHNPSTHDEKNSGSNSPKEDNFPGHCQDRAEAKKVINDFNPKLQRNGVSQKKELNLDSGRDGENRESKAMRIFRVALIDFVKDLVRPTWVEGRLSKDAHKKIVKNAVEKVVSTIQPHETPSTEESINQYLSISKPKMAKLVEGYVVKYAKS